MQLLNIGCNGHNITWLLTNITTKSQECKKMTSKIKIADMNAAYFKVKCKLIQESAQKGVQEKESIISTPYNRLLRRQITVSTTDQDKFFGKGVGEVFLFAKINKRICGLQLMIENIFNVWRYCSSNLTLFQVQISFLSARQNLCLKKMHKKQLSAPAECLRNKTYNIYWVTLKLQLLSSNSVKFHLKCPFNKRTVCP